MRIIRFFDKESDSYVGETVLPDIPINKLQEAFCVSPGNPMYDSFPIQEAQARILTNYVEINFELSKYDYFLEFDSHE